MSETVRGAFIAAVALLLSCTAGGTPASAQPAVPVKAAAATRQDVPVILRNLGTVTPLNTVLVRARVDGTLDQVAFTEGQEVHAGELLAQIDPRPYAATLAQAMAKRAADTAQMGNLKRDLGRYQNLARSEFASRQQVDTQAASVDQQGATMQGDDAAVASARLNLDYASIKSPIDGRVGLRMVDPGNLIHATDAQGIVTVTQIKPISVIFTLPQDTLPQVQAAIARSPGGKLPVQSFAGDDRTDLGHGTLLTIDNQIDAATGTYRLKAVFPNADERLWPGEFVNAHLEVETLKDALTVPSAAVQRGPGGVYVYVVKPDQTVAMQPVELRQDDGQLAVVTKGLDPNAQVVTDGQSRLQTGAKVSVQAPRA